MWAVKVVSYTNSDVECDCHRLTLHPTFDSAKQRFLKELLCIVPNESKLDSDFAHMYGNDNTEENVKRFCNCRICYTYCDDADYFDIRIEQVNFGETVYLEGGLTKCMF